MESQDQMDFLNRWATERANQVQKDHPKRDIVNVTLNTKDLLIELSPIKKGN